MSRQSHAKCRLRERLPGIGMGAVMKQFRKTHGWYTGPAGICTHYLMVQGHLVKAVYNWRTRRLVTVMKEGNA